MTVNLEEIWETGAVLEGEESAPTNVPVDLHCSGVTLCGRVIRAENHEFVWRLEIEFSPLTLWSAEQFRPEHLLDPSELG